MIASLSAFLAQSPTSAPSGTPKPPPSLFDGGMLPLMIGMFAIFYFLMIRPQSKERKKREGMMNALKKNDKVQTIGGIIGTVTAVRDDEVTLKVDESSNTKITFSKAAIQRVLTQSPASASVAGEADAKK